MLRSKGKSVLYLWVTVIFNSSSNQNTAQIMVIILQWEYWQVTKQYTCNVFNTECFLCFASRIPSTFCTQNWWRYQIVTTQTSFVHVLTILVSIFDKEQGKKIGLNLIMLIGKSLRRYWNSENLPKEKRLWLWFCIKGYVSLHSLSLSIKKNNL